MGIFSTTRVIIGTFVVCAEKVFLKPVIIKGT